MENRTVLNALFYICRNGCPCRTLPEKFSNQHTIYVRFNCWAKKVYGSRFLPRSGRKTCRNEGSSAGFDVGHGAPRRTRVLKTANKLWGSRAEAGQRYTQ
ncbi:transposase [Treponema endosymbiont of Eucomonympha sp.]|uniref:transposase n=1 Tax=Treponema endosymbiont of Eucomonympha sp. TaxID=1580831 RepID=UPI0035A0DA88